MIAAAAGRLPRPDREVVRVTGADRTDYLHRMLSQDVKGLAHGGAADACVLTPKGRLLGAPTVLHVGDALLLDLDAPSVEAVLAHLERTVITEDVAFERLGAGVRRHALVGTPTLSGASPEPLRHATVVISGVEVRVLRRDAGARPCLECLVPAPGEAAFLDALRASGTVPLDREAWDALRVTERIPAWGFELGPEVMPLEARLGESHVSWTKGCYPGQEPVAMARHRGHPANLLVRVALEGPAASGAPLLAEGRAAGRLTTVAGDRALAYVRYDRVEAGFSLAIEGGGAARLLDGR